MNYYVSVPHSITMCVSHNASVLSFTFLCNVIQSQREFMEITLAIASAKPINGSLLVLFYEFILKFVAFSAVIRAVGMHWKPSYPLEMRYSITICPA